MKKIHVSSIQVMHWASEKNGAKNSNFQIPIQIYIYISGMKKIPMHTFRFKQI